MQQNINTAGHQQHGYPQQLVEPPELSYHHQDLMHANGEHQLQAQEANQEQLIRIDDNNNQEEEK